MGTARGDIFTGNTTRLTLLRMGNISVHNFGDKGGGARGGAVVEALRYKSEDRGIDSRWCHWNFSLT
jgi:hypothetical protein